MSLQIGICGYGNLGRGVENAIRQNADMELAAVFTRRDPSSVIINTEGVPVLNMDQILAFKGKLDVLILCGGSATDLPELTPLLAKDFNVIDSFDTHARIPEHFSSVDDAARENGNTALISCGWDPGMFSLNRLLSEAILPDGKSYTFWGTGVSQGHSDAVRRVKGVSDARSYTIPIEEAMDEVRSGNGRSYKAGEMHRRRVFVVPEEDADKAVIEKEIKEMPNYFSDYETEVIFVSGEEMEKSHMALPHGGFVIRSGSTGLSGENDHIIEYSLRLDSNPEFTGSVLTAYARAVARLNKENCFGCKTVFDIPPSYLSQKTGEELRRSLL